MEPWPHPINTGEGMERLPGHGAAFECPDTTHVLADAFDIPESDILGVLRDGVIPADLPTTTEPSGNYITRVVYVQRAGTGN